MTLFQFIKTCRMQKALELMEASPMNISEIVYHIGYESTATFSNLFKQLVGISPQNNLRLESPPNEFLKKTTKIVCKLWK
ncbi:MAG: hypothetical protein JWP37_233 [Mucilaginibacter sp.]|nr:hypothetical protein [Mucilaginibacter sp.]